MRTCNICNIEKELFYFEKMPTKPEGRGYRCNSCNRTRRKSPNWQLSRPKICPACGDNFDDGKASKIYCSKECNDSYEIVRISSKPIRYFQRCLNPKRVKDGLKAQELLDLYNKQDGCCALTGVKMTFICGAGAVGTNVSIDRIEAGKSYNINNIQLVCSAVNSFRNKIELADFIDWCHKVSDYNKAKGGRN